MYVMKDGTHLKVRVHFVFWQKNNNHLQTNIIRREGGSNFTVFESFKPKVHTSETTNTTSCYIKMYNGKIKNTQTIIRVVYHITFRWKY